jgi:exosortase F-associated protein
MNKVIKIGLVLFLTMLLILIRFFESNLFYDPLYLYFKSDYSNLPIPEIETLRFAGNITLRYIINSTISLVILWVLFKSRSIVKLSSILYFVFFVLLLSIFCFLLFYSEPKNLFALFYVRRFLIQPIFLLLLVPAFYFQKHN